MVLIFAIFILLLSFSFAIEDAPAQLVNLRGNIEGSYGQTLVDTNTGQTRSPSFLHRYTVGSFGGLWDPRFGTYDADFTYQEDIGKTDGIRTRDQDTLDYRLSFNVLPRRTPITFFAQRITRDNEVEPSTSRNRLDTYSLTWDVPLERAPHLRFNLFQSDSKTEPSSFGLTRTRTASVDASHRFQETSWFTRYQYSEQDTAELPKTRAHSVNLNTETRLSPSLTFNARGNYSNRAATLGVVNPQLSTFQQRSAGATLIHHPSLSLNNRVTYDYFRDPFERHIFQGSSNYRATEKLDLFGNYRFLRFGLESSLIQSHFAILGTNYRPILGVTAGLNLSYSLTDVNAVTDTIVYSQQTNYFVNYLKTLERVILNTGYSGSYIRTAADPGDLSTDLINTITLGANNADTRYVSLGTSYSFSNIYRQQSSEPSESLDQHSFNLTAQSNFLRNLLLRGDLLTLNGSANYLIFEITEGSDTSFRTDETITYDTLRGIILSGGHSYEDVAGADERHIIFGQLQWITFLARNLYLTASARENLQLFLEADNLTQFEGRTNLIYQLGRITMSLEYTFVQQDQADTEFRTHSFFVRANRPLF